MTPDPFDRSSRLALLALAALVAGACNDDGTGVDLGDFEPRSVIIAVEDLVLRSVPASEASPQILDVLEQLGAWEDGTASADLSGTSPGPLLRGLTPLVRRHVPLLPQVDFGAEAGSTYVYDETLETWTADPEREGAPVDGIRVVIYAVNSEGTIALPTAEIGYADLVDLDTEGTESLGVRVVDTEADAQFTIADLTQSLTITPTATGTIEYGEASGVLRSNATEAVDFQIRSTRELFGSGENADSETDFLLSFQGPVTSFAWDIQGTSDADAGTFTEAFTVTVTNGGVPTVLTLDIDTGVDVPRGEGELTHAAALIANVALTDSGYEFTTPDGGAYNQAAESDLQNTIVSMFIGGLLLQRAVPVLFFTPLLL